MESKLISAETGKPDFGKTFSSLYTIVNKEQIQNKNSKFSLWYLAY